MTARYSLAEIEAQCRKAARGAGCSWGMAEEAGKAARWLAAFGLPGPEVLARLLEAPRRCACGGADAAAPLCALAVGASLSDRGEALLADGAGEIENVTAPLLLLPQLGRVAEAYGRCLHLEWEGFAAFAMPEGIALHQIENPDAETASHVRYQLCEGQPVLIRPGTGSRIVEAAAWERLGTLAHRTYVPASEASRAAGAGAGLTDND